MRSSGSGRLSEVFSRCWRKLVDECPDARRERLRSEHIYGLQQRMALLEAIRLWEIDNQKMLARDIERAN
jgi:hypothetical protein